MWARLASVRPTVGAGVVDEEFLTGAVDLAHGAFEGFGELGVFGASVSPRFSQFVNYLGSPTSSSKWI